MLAKSRVVTQAEEKLTPVAGHVSVALEKLVLVWGGYCASKSEQTEKYRNPSYLFVYHTEYDKWLRFQTDGAVPGENCGCCAVLSDDLKLYVFGGFFVHNAEASSSLLHMLDLTRMNWTQLAPTSLSIPSPRHKLAGWEYQKKLYFFGGFGPPPSTLAFTSRSASYLKDAGQFVADGTSAFHSHRYSWNNQLVVFDETTRSWTNPRCLGKVPLPRAAHAAVKTTKDVVVLFGGRHKERRLNDLFILDLKTLFWTEIDTSPRPCGRSWHCLCQLKSSELILYGGFTQDCEPLDDCWLLNTESWWWRRVGELERAKKRLWHTGAVVHETLYVYGGCESNILLPTDKDYCADLVKVNESPQSLLQLCVQRLVRCEVRKKSLRNSDCLPTSLRKKLMFAQQKSFKKGLSSVRELLLI